MNFEVIREILIPLLGTVLGSACVFFMKDKMGERLQKILTGFAAGVMVAASIWSLILPSLEQSQNMGKLAFVPATVGFWTGILFLLVLDKIIPHIHLGAGDRPTRHHHHTHLRPRLKPRIQRPGQGVGALQCASGRGYHQRLHRCTARQRRLGAGRD